MNTDSKPHSLYCRYNSLCKRPPVPEDLNVPNLEELIQRATEEGKLTRGNKRAAPSTPKAKGAAAAGTPGSNKRKAPATPKGGKAAKVAKVVKVEEESDDEKDSNETAVESDEEAVKDEPEMEDADAVAA